MKTISLKQLRLDIYSPCLISIGFDKFHLMDRYRNILFRLKDTDIYPKAQRKYREEGKSRDTAEDVVQRILENKNMFSDGSADQN